MPCSDAQCTFWDSQLVHKGFHKAYLVAVANGLSLPCSIFGQWAKAWIKKRHKLGYWSTLPPFRQLYSSHSRLCTTLLN